MGSKPVVSNSSKSLFGLGLAAQGIKTPAFSVFLLFLVQILGLSAAIPRTIQPLKRFRTNSHRS